jgi:hypothetical protein
MSKLFLNLMRFAGESKEDFFTECLAATLQEDTALARHFLVALCVQGIDEVSIRNSAIKIETQAPFPHSCVDMVFKVGGLSVGVENKLWSREGEGQLAKYLRLPLNRVAFITGYYSRISPEVLNHPSYMKPTNGRGHFMWSDFFTLVETSAKRPSTSVLNKALLALFVHLGFEPPRPEIGDLLDPDDLLAKENRRNFAKLWTHTRTRLQERGWTSFSSGSIAELYVRKGNSKQLSWVWLDPVQQPGNLRVGLNFDRGVDLDKAVAEIEASTNPLIAQAVVIQRMARRDKSKAPVVDVQISFNTLFGKISTADSMSKRLADYVLAVLDLVS